MQLKDINAKEDFNLWNRWKIGKNKKEFENQTLFHL